ncbi:MAG: hypothetical protein JNM56_02365, partial [Planctomycetia bacterium]|nr:hypothetical protein [Planctomycetia bacterium]
LESWGRRAPASAERPLTQAEIEALIDGRIAQRLDELVEEKLEHPEKLPPDGDNLAGLLATLLEKHLTVDRQKVASATPRPTYDLILYQRPNGVPEVHSGVVCVATESATSATAYLRRLDQDSRPLQRVFLITDQRRPLPLGTTGRAYLDNLRLRYGTRLDLVELTLAQHAELNALQAVVGQARAGDLEVVLPGGQARRITEAEILASKQRQERFHSHPLLHKLLSQ